MSQTACLPLGPVRVSGAEDRLVRDARWSDLMARAQAGDARAYDALLRECLPLLRAICRQRLRDAAEVEDAVQDTLLTLHRVRATYDRRAPSAPGSPPSPSAGRWIADGVWRAAWPATPNWRQRIISAWMAGPRTS